MHVRSHDEAGDFLTAAAAFIGSDPFTTSVIAVVAALAAGAGHVVLYADLANPTSNSIYQAIGYRFNHDAESRLFGEIAS
jgi:hypothetical protein